MIDYTQILPEILSNYAVTIVHHEHVRTSENVVVKLRTDSGKTYALRIRRITGSYREQIMSELTILRDFRDATQADVPAPLPTRDGRLFCDLAIHGDSYVGILFHWVAGTHLDARLITPAHLATMSRSVAVLHQFSCGYIPPEGLVRPVYDAEWFFGATSWSRNESFTGRMNPNDAAFLRAANDQVRASIQDYPHNPASFGLIHYDLHTGNFLFQENRANLIDFDECGFGYYLFDLAHILFELIDRPQYAAFRRVVTEEYANVRSTGPLSEHDMNVFSALQGIAYINWLNRIFNRDGNEDAMKYWVPKIIERLKKLI